MKTAWLVALVVACAAPKSRAADVAKPPQDAAATAEQINKVDGEINAILDQIQAVSKGKYDLQSYKMPVGITPDQAGKAKVQAVVDSRALPNLMDKLKQISGEALASNDGATPPVGRQPPLAPSDAQKIALLALDAGGRLAPSNGASAACAIAHFLNTDSAASSANAPYGDKGVQVQVENLKAAVANPRGFWSSHFGIYSVEVQGARITGVDGTGPGAAISVGVFKSKYVKVKAMVGASQMGGIVAHDTQDLGPVDPGNPDYGNLQARSVINSPPTRYRKFASVEITPFNALSDNSRLSLLKTRVRPFAEVTAGTAKPQGPAWVHTTVGVVDPTGAFTPQQVLDPAAQPLDPKDARSHFAATLGGGVNVRLDKNDRYNAVAHMAYAPTGWKEYSAGIQINKPVAAIKGLFKHDDKDKK